MRDRLLREALAFLDPLGFHIECESVGTTFTSITWMRTDCGVRAIWEDRDHPWIQVLVGSGGILGLGEAMRLLAPDRWAAGPRAEAPSEEWLRFQASFLVSHASEILGAPSDLLERILRARAAWEREGWEDFLDDCERHFGFLVAELGFASPLPSILPIQCSLVYRRHGCEVLVAQNADRSRESATFAPPRVMILPESGSSDAIGLDEALFFLDPDGVRDLAALARHLQAHHVVLLATPCPLLPQIRERRETIGDLGPSKARKSRKSSMRKSRK